VGGGVSLSASTHPGDQCTPCPSAIRVKHNPRIVMQRKVCKHMEDSFQVTFIRQIKVSG
jgi:hypothetical protein